MEKKRSIGVTIFGWYLIISSIVYFSTLLFRTFSKGPVTEVHWNTFAPLIWIGAIILGKRLLKLQKWARKVLLWWFIIFCLLTPIAILLFGASFIHFGQIAGIAISIVGIIYFTRPKVKEQFE